MTAAKHLRNNNASVTNYDSLGSKFPHETSISILSRVLKSYVFFLLDWRTKRNLVHSVHYFPSYFQALLFFFSETVVFRVSQQRDSQERRSRSCQNHATATTQSVLRVVYPNPVVSENFRKRRRRGTGIFIIVHIMPTVTQYVRRFTRTTSH